MGLDGDNEDVSDSERLSRQPSEASLCATEEEEEEAHLQLGPNCSIKEHLEKDKVCFSQAVFGSKIW